MPIEFSRRWRLNEILFPRSRSAPQELTAAVDQLVIPVWDLFTPRLGESYLRSFQQTALTDGAAIASITFPEPAPGRIWVVHRLSTSHDSVAVALLSMSQLVSTTSTRDPWNVWFDTTTPANRVLQITTIGTQGNGFNSTRHDEAKGLIIPRGSQLVVAYADTTGAAPGAGITALANLLFIDVPGEILPVLETTS